jgi:hypothetical protein
LKEEGELWVVLHKDLNTLHDDNLQEAIGLSLQASLDTEVILRVRRS